MNEIRFTIPGKPFGKQRPRVVNRGKFSTAYTPKETVEYENLVKLYYSQTAHGYMFPDDAMLDVRIFAFYEGVYASHGYERSHVDGVKNTFGLLKAYLG